MWLSALFLQERGTRPPRLAPVAVWSPVTGVTALLSMGIDRNGRARQIHTQDWLLSFVHGMRWCGHNTSDCVSRKVWDKTREQVVMAAFLQQRLVIIYSCELTVLRGSGLNTGTSRHTCAQPRGWTMTGSKILITPTSRKCKAKWHAGDTSSSTCSVPSPVLWGSFVWVHPHLEAIWELVHTRAHTRGLAVEGNLVLPCKSQHLGAQLQLPHLWKRSNSWVCFLLYVWGAKIRKGRKEMPVCISLAALNKVFWQTLF